MTSGITAVLSAYLLRARYDIRPGQAFSDSQNTIDDDRVNTFFDLQLRLISTSAVQGSKLDDVP